VHRPRSAGLEQVRRFGILLLATGSIGALTSVIRHAGVIAVLSLMGLAGAILSATLPATN
jgi:hypothetical protein